MAVIPHPWSFAQRPDRRLGAKAPMTVRRHAGARPSNAGFDRRHALVDLPTWADDGPDARGPVKPT
jgi:hypothetical protein